MVKDILALVRDTRAINSKVISVPRLLILHALEQLGKDGALYRDLKAGLDMEDGLLYSNIMALREMGYVKEKDVTLGNKEMASYCITDEGKEALITVRDWFKKV